MIKRLIQRRTALWAMPDAGPDQELMALDCETTGLDPRRAELVSVAAVPIRAGRVCAGAALDLRLEAPGSLDRHSILIHRLRGKDLDDGLTVVEALRRLTDFIGGRPLVGWCLDFDLAVINRQLRAETGVTLSNRVVEVSDLYRRRQRRRNPDVPPDLRFETVARELDVPVIGRHTARGDATTTALMYLKLTGD